MKPKLKTKPRAKVKSSIAEGHNPNRFTVARVGKGWRLLTTDEIRKRTYATDLIQGWRQDLRDWEGDGWYGDSLDVTYRTRKPAGYWLTR